MKRKYCILSIICAFVVIILFLGFNNIFFQIVRYSTIQESLEKSVPHNVELIDILENKDVALLICEKEGKYLKSIIFKDEKGWTSFKYSLSPNSELYFDDLYVRIFEINNKKVIDINYINDNEESNVNITDNVNFNIQTSVNSIFVDGLIVFDDEIPRDYIITISGREYIIN